MINLPNLPPKEDLEYREKDLLLSVYEEFARSSRIPFYILIIVLIIAYPLTALLRVVMTKAFVSSYTPPPVVSDPYHAKPLQVLKVQILSVAPGIFSVFAQVINPNPTLSAKSVAYDFVLKGTDGEILKKVEGENYLFPSESKFFLLPHANVPSVPNAAELTVREVKWTRRIPKVDIRLEVLQKTTGVTPEGNFFVEGLVKNLQGFLIKKVNLDVMIFDKNNQNILAINSTLLDDLVPFESRYFKLLWPANEKQLFRSSKGQVQVLPSLNLLVPGLVLEEESQKVPVR